MERRTYDIDASISCTGGLTSGAAGSDTLCLADGCYSISVGGFYDSEITFDFGGLVGATDYDNLVVGAADNYVLIPKLRC